MTITEIIVTILLGTAAGFINTFAGGGSMLVVPFLIFIGLPANVANATNRIAILLQNVVSVSGFKQKKILDFKTDSKLLLPVALGSIVGAFIAVDINEEIFKKVIAGLLIVMFFMQGIIPYGPQLLMAAGLASITPLAIMQYLYYPYLMGVAALLAIFFRYPRKYSR